MSLIIATGTNLGEREENLNTATDILKQKFSFIASSNIYESAAVDYLNQPKFLNQVHEFKIPNKLTPIKILKILKNIEKNMGREKTIPKGPRIIDLDIIFLGKTIYNSQNLTIPHPRTFERSFVILPLKELPFYNKIKNDFSFQISFETNATIYSR
jgi:2-amino-4-hydroxy-6-hydroxymethyldihydropteridine diphosphokinase